MTDFSTVKKNLETRGFQVSTFQTAAEAADYLNAAMDGVSVGFGGSITLDQMGLYEKLRTHNDVVWHWKTDDQTSCPLPGHDDGYVCHLRQRPGGDRRAGQY